MACTAQELLNAATAAGFTDPSISEKQLLAIIAQLTCEGGGGGGGGGEAHDTGSGSPEGVVTADVGAIYFDTDANSFWYKRTGSGNTGWIQLIA